MVNRVYTSHTLRCIRSSETSKGYVPSGMDLETAFMVLEPAKRPPSGQEKRGRPLMKGGIRLMARCCAAESQSRDHPRGGAPHFPPALESATAGWSKALPPSAAAQRPPR